jgi:hypothetical protein
MSLLVQGQEEGETSWSILPVPAFGYAPETDLSFGAVVMSTFDLYPDTLSRSSFARIEFNYTLRNQYIIESRWAHFFKEERWFTEGLLHYSHFPDRYFGLGADTPDENETEYESDRVRATVTFLKKVAPDWFLGPSARFVRFSVGDIEGLDFSELRSASAYGLSLIGQLEQRQNLLTPRGGYFLRLESSVNYAEDWYNLSSIDLRKYFSPKETTLKDVFALRLASFHSFGQLPFFEYPAIGGQDLIRGYFLGRFRTRNMSTFQMEYRTDVYWRFGLVVFGGMTAMYDGLVGWDESNWKYNIGTGLRFLFDREDDVYLRLDYGIGRDGQTGFYVSFGEAF